MYVRAIQPICVLIELYMKHQIEHGYNNIVLYTRWRKSATKRMPRTFPNERARVLNSTHLPRAEFFNTILVGLRK